MAADIRGDSGELLVVSCEGLSFYSGGGLQAEQTENGGKIGKAEFGTLTAGGG